MVYQKIISYVFHNSLIPRGAYFLLPLDGWLLSECQECTYTEIETTKVSLH